MKILSQALLSSLALALVTGTPAGASYETYEIPFSLTFGSEENRDDGSGLLMTPSGDPFSLQWDHLRLGAGHASAMAVAGNYEAGHRFGLRAEVRMEQFVPDKADDRIGFAALGGPHDPPGSAFNTTDGGFYGLVWGPSVDATRSVIEIREGFEGEVLAQEDWDGVHPSADNSWAGMWETFQLEASGTYDGTGALTLTFTLTDHLGHAQSVSALIAQPREGNLFGFGGLLSSDGGGDPAFAFLNFSASGSLMLAERFEDGERLVHDLPRTAAWYGSPGNTAADPVLSQPADGIITLDLTVRLDEADPDTRQNGQIITHFTDSGPVSLAVGETLRLAFDFQMTAVGGNNFAVRIGVLDSSGGGGRVTDDNQGTSHPRFNGYAGYAAFLNPNATGTSTMRIRERNPDNNALLSTASVWSNRATGGDDILIHDNTDYSGEILIARGADGVNVTFSVFGDTIGPEATVSWDENAGGTFDFDTFAIWVNRSWAESFSLTSVDIEVLSAEPAPEGATFAAWQVEHFPGETDPAIIGPDANPAGDGVTNFLKYAFSLDPLKPVTAADFLQREMVDGKVRLTYFERTDAIDIEYVPQVSMDLATWSEDPDNVAEVSREPVAGEDLESVTVEAVPGGDPDKAFLRVKIREKQ